MNKLIWTNDDKKCFDLVNDELINNLIKFAENHNYDITTLLKEKNCNSLDIIKLILHKMNFTIEVTETSSAGIINGITDNNVWVRNHNYRWLITEWNDDSSLKHNNYNYNKETKKEEFFNTYYDAIYNAIQYILKNC